MWSVPELGVHVRLQDCDPAGVSVGWPPKRDEHELPLTGDRQRQPERPPAVRSVFTSNYRTPNISDSGCSRARAPELP
jgi:hypothetical protein